MHYPTDVVHLGVKCRIMKKAVTKKKTVAYKSTDALSKAEEPIAPYYRSVKVVAAVKDFTYNEFKKIADKVAFTQAEWAAILHVSERTLQRYAKNNGVFAPINAQRALQIAKVIEMGKITFGSFDTFYSWIKRKPYSLEGNLSFESLTTAEGIEKVITQLHRIQHGLFA